MPLRVNTTTIYAAELGPEGSPRESGHARPIRLAEIGQGALWTADPTRDDGIIRSPRARQCWDNAVFGTVGHLAVTNADPDDPTTSRLAALKMRRFPSGGDALRVTLAEWEQRELKPNGLRLIIVHTSRQIISTWETHLSNHAGVSA